ncbi:DUF5119 domain-containing protein [Bacteroides sp. 214]|uniref:fimbrillin family protein n=1 Tax=Bacteroides sp. 214 TaxID=2302935 RepID=UPI0013D7E9FA|nr:fimbrillin family protein [Bacteroides sp. 214]NDW13173.1 DUF5119 domain-containing protein [Bacteroides sp. 214]
MVTRRVNKHIITFILLLTGIVACQQKELHSHPFPTGDIPVNVIIHWEDISRDMITFPSNMTVHWYPQSSSLISSDMDVYGGIERLDATVYDVMCMDFNGHTNMAFRSKGTRESFEAYNMRATGIYNSLVPQLPGGETTVAETYPYQFYIDSRSQFIDLQNISADEEVTVHFYPKDVLREFTFLIYDVIGAQNMVKNGGAISGMSASYFPATGELAPTPSTILFSRVEAIRDAQKSSRWSEQEKALFTAKNPSWASTDTLVGWTRDWVVGKFVTFGPLDTNDNRFRLTVETINSGNTRYYGAWGYWQDEWEDTIAEQLKGAMGENGTLEEQLAWRERNGGYDIVLYNDHRLSVNADEGDKGPTDGGFTIGVEDWGEIIDVPTRGMTRSNDHYTDTRAPINTYATIPDFVINGIHTDDSDWSFLFDEQYVYKPESGLIWDYYPKKYWPQGGKVDFYAYAPAGIKNFITGLSHNGDDTTPPVIEYAMPYKGSEEPPLGTGEPTPPRIVSNDQEDLLVATYTCESPHTEAIPLNFQHAFSRVTARAKAAKNNDTYRIKVVRMDLRNLYSRGKYNYGTPTATVWSDLSQPASYRFNLITSAVTIEEEYTTLVSSNDGIFVMPQEVLAGNETVVYVEYDIYTVSPINGEQYYTSATKKLPVVEGFIFEIGKQYQLQMTLDVP